MPHQRLIAFIATVVATITVIRLFQDLPYPQHPGRALWVLVVPVTLAFVPLVWRRLKIPAGLLMILFSLIAMSVWTFYLVCAVLMLLPEKGEPAHR